MHSCRMNDLFSASRYVKCADMIAELTPIHADAGKGIGNANGATANLRVRTAAFAVCCRLHNVTVLIRRFILACVTW